MSTVSDKGGGSPGGGRGGRSWSATWKVMFDAVLRPGQSLASASCPASPLRSPGVAGEEVQIFFRGCRPVGATALLFRVKREGFSYCRAEALPDGVLLYCRR